MFRLLVKLVKMDKVDLSFDGVVKKFQNKFTMIDLFVFQLNLRSRIAHSATYELTTEIKDGGLGNWRGSYVDSWYRSNHFHPFDEEEDEGQDPPTIKGERVTFKLFDKKLEHPLKMCFYEGDSEESSHGNQQGRAGQFPCACYHGPDGLFCSSHTKMIKGNPAAYNQTQVDHIVAVRLVKVWEMLEEELGEIGGPPDEITVGYSYGENLHDGEAILNRVSWEVSLEDKK